MTKDSLSQNIVRLRKARKWSQEKLAQEAEVSYHTVFRAESGTKPKTENLLKIARALDVSETELLHGAAATPIKDEASKAELILKIQATLTTLNKDQLRNILSLSEGYASSVAVNASKIKA